MKSSLEIAQDAVLKPIEQIAEDVGLEDEEFEPYGRYKAKIGLSVIDRLNSAPTGKLVCEVPKCGFDFEERFGKLGKGYAQVHHLAAVLERPAFGIAPQIADDNDLVDAARHEFFASA